MEARDTIRTTLGDRQISHLLEAEQIKELQQLTDKVDLAEDRFLYQQIVSSKPQCQNQIERYFKLPFKQKMRLSVEQYEKYLKKHSEPIPLTLTMTSISWGDAWHNYKHTVDVTLDGTSVINGSLTAERHSSSGQIGTPASVTRKLRDTVSVHVTVVRKGWWVGQGDYDAGKGEYTGTVENLNGKTITLTAPDHTNEAAFRVDGIPQEPSLPLWGQE